MTGDGATGKALRAGVWRRKEPFKVCSFTNTRRFVSPGSHCTTAPLALIYMTSRSSVPRMQRSAGTCCARYLLDIDPNPVKGTPAAKVLPYRT